MPTPLNEERLRESIWPRLFRFYPQTGSTNDLAATWAEDGAPNGAVIVTDEQLSGRGRFNRPWEAPAASSLLFSVILRPPSLHHDFLQRLTMVGAVAVHEALSEYAPGQITLKWPNDVGSGGRKLAGILTESVWEDTKLRYAIMGIGINIWADFRGSPLEETAISLNTISTKRINRAILLNAILRRIDSWMVGIEQPPLFEAWRSRLVTLGRQVTVRLGNEGESRGIVGRAIDVDPDGALQLVDEAGEIHRFIAGEVSLAPSSNR